MTCLRTLQHQAAAEVVDCITQVMVFFSSCNSVKYHGELLNYIDIPVKDIHGKQKQQRRTSTFFEFCEADKGILLCTDVAARGLDIPGLLTQLLSFLKVFVKCCHGNGAGKHLVRLVAVLDLTHMLQQSAYGNSCP